MLFRHPGRNCTVYEIYPESETPNLTQIAHLDFDPSESEGFQVCLLPGTAIWHVLYDDTIVFRVWDYQLNHSISFSVDVVADYFASDLEVYFILLKHCISKPCDFLTKPVVTGSDRSDL